MRFLQKEYADKLLYNVRVTLGRQFRKLDYELLERTMESGELEMFKTKGVLLKFSRLANLYDSLNIFRNVKITKV
jgi:hypothetical protein